jgi:uncharacterized membrane protein YhdT
MNDIISSISLLITLITYFFDRSAKELTTVVEKEIPPVEQKQAINKTKKELKKAFAKSVFYFSIYLVFAFLLAPTTIDIFKSSSFSLVKFDLPSTIFIMINIAVIYFVLSSFIIVKKVWKKKRRCV